ncbi:NfeD family protein [Acidiplasma cupricumulans]|uniref:NfeD family protein n=1 Tax=Acidiplasma cupricumulans TaxID=312540 RepID=UPI000781B08D|nr:NfeD family protein [Acidiplasma cupricumulans]
MLTRLHQICISEGKFSFNPAAVNSGSVPATLIILFIIFFLVLFIIVYYIAKIITSQRSRRYTGAESLINKIGIAQSEINKNETGTVTVDGVPWEAVNIGDEVIKKYDTLL